MVEGWCSVEELIGWGFAHAPVVMANEAHNGLARCIRTREVGIRMIRAAHEAGVRRLAMEALPWPAQDTPGPIAAIPPVPGGYLAQPDMRRLVTAALELGWSLWAYEAVFEPAAGTDPAEMLTMEFTNWRDREQARNLCRVRAAAPAEPLLVWCGNGHACKEATSEWVPMVALSRHVGYRPVRHRSDRDGGLRQPIPAVGPGAAGHPRPDPGRPRRHGWDPPRPRSCVAE